MSKYFKLISIIFFLLLFPLIVYAQDDSNNEIVIDILLFPSEGDNFDRVEDQYLSEDEVDQLLKELKTLSLIPENERSIEEWKRIIQIVLLISSSGVNVTEEYYFTILEYITGSKELAEQNKLLIQDNQELILENERLLEENKFLSIENETLLLENIDLLYQMNMIQQSYQNDISNLLFIIYSLENSIPQNNTLFISPSISINNGLGIGINYLTNVNRFIIGGGINLHINPFDIAFQINIGISF